MAGAVEGTGSGAVRWQPACIRALRTGDALVPSGIELAEGDERGRQPGQVVGSGGRGIGETSAPPDRRRDIMVNEGPRLRDDSTVEWSQIGRQSTALARRSSQLPECQILEAEKTRATPIGATQRTDAREPTTRALARHRAAPDRCQLGRMGGNPGSTRSRSLDRAGKGCSGASRYPPRRPRCQLVNSRKMARFETWS